MSILDDRVLVNDDAFSNDYMESLSEVRRNIIEDCMIALGYPVITLFITQRQIDRLINFSVRRCESKACQNFLETLYSNGGCIDVSKYNMEAVKFIYRADIGGSSVSGSSEGGTGNCSCGCSCGNSSSGSSLSPYSGCDICDKLCKYRMYSFGLTGGAQQSRMYDMMAFQYARSELENLELDDWYLDAVEGKLYVDGFSGWITIEYVKSSVSMEDLEENTYWKSWVRDYTLAMVKITEGRIRGKYRISSGVFEIEADELINEGQSEKENLEQRLDEDMGYWNILRG